MEYHDSHSRHRFTIPTTSSLDDSHETKRKLCRSAPILEAVLQSFRQECSIPATLLFKAGDGVFKMENRHDWDAQRRYMTSAGYRVRSKAEKIIADFLTTSELAFVYEPQLKIGQRFFRPDFYFPEYGLLYEHFGLNTLEYLQTAEAKIQAYHQAGIPFIYTTFNDESDIEDVLVDKLTLATLEL